MYARFETSIKVSMSALPLCVFFWASEVNDNYVNKINKRLRNMALMPFEAGAKVEVKRLAFKPSMIPTDETEKLLALVDEEAKKIRDHLWLGKCRWWF